MEEIACTLTKRWNREVSEQEVTWIIAEKLAPFGIIAGQCNLSDHGGSSRAAKGPMSLLFRIPLLSEKRLRPLTSVGQFFFSKRLLVALLVVGCIVHIAVYLQLYTIMPTFNFRQLQLHGYDSAAVVLISMASTVVHELGHLSACHRYGARYGHLGGGVYLLRPVAYVDVTDTWRLPRWERVMVDMGGIYFQIVFNIVLYGLYLWLRTPVLLVSVVVISAMFAFNLNPMFKYDGYWALSDAIGVPNLHKRVGDLWRQLLPFPGKKQTNAFLQTQPYAKAVMWIYALSMTAYLGYFTWMMVWLVPTTIRDYPGILTSAMTLAWQNLQARDIVGAVSSGSQIMFPTFLLIAYFLLVKRLALALYKLGKGCAECVKHFWTTLTGY
jgi:putative peptide zinc metalloprotease protein